jgi:biofilm PGA synthesis N-glycosyltransferase PgaC
MATVMQRSIAFGRWFIGMQPLSVRVYKSSLRLSVTVIVPAYNEEASIADTVRSIQAQTYSIDEIVVVDDCSNDRTGEIARALGATVLRTPHNQGTKAQAQNYALPYVKTSLFATIDADTTLAPNAIERTLRYFNDPKALVVCGFVVPQKINTIWERGRFIEYLYGLTIIKPAQNHNRTVVVASGCFSVFRTDPIRDEFGGFQSRTMAEDMDLTWEIEGAGYHAYFASDAVCYPVDPPTFRIYIQQVGRWNRSFLQNISARKFFRFKRLRLAVLVYAYLAWTIIGPAVLPFIFWNLTRDLLTTVVFLVVTQMIMLWIPALIGAVRIGNDPAGLQFKENHEIKNLPWEATKSFIPSFCTQYVNMAMFYYAIWKEWILRERLDKWDKGH